ncbi:hypothetical protein JR316_0009796 [Psilocybe cubensis]|uniref:F-box domain-containing protein n=2 Tax=Psilocybe cubensis TaxID=181762 RepID=A0A8H8CFE8_PSICU|nr:hypothetical protein JR316_0009796 [Psilocybe cubensis]KAH9477574.1 hypothetical protein JR316_0009796 [Psilocybe cubensis]
MSPANNIFQLPQELVEKILDDVALECFRDGDGKLNDLKACSLVSKRFCTRSRHHMFSYILFTLDEHGQRRAAKLLDILRQNPSLAHVVTHHLHTFGLISNDDFTQLELRKSCIPGIDESFERLRQQVASFFNRKNNVYDLLGLINQAPIVHFSLGGWCLFNNKSTINKSQVIDSALRIIKSPSIRSLRFSELFILPPKLVYHALVSSQLRELSFRRIPSMPRETEATDPIEGLQIAPNLQRLELKRVYYFEFLSLILALAQGGGAKTITTFPIFRHLHTLVVTINSSHGEMESLWTLLLGVAPSLETLDIQHTGRLGNPWPDTPINHDIDSIRGLYHRPPPIGLQSDHLGIDRN